MSSDSSISSISDTRNYTVRSLLGEGVHGRVMGCYKINSDEMVAVKFLKKRRHSMFHDRKEFHILEQLKGLDPEESRIVKCHEWYHGRHTAYAVFEMLDMSLKKFLEFRKGAPLPLNGVKTIIKDVATALVVLKKNKLIHTDLKLDNIMLTNHQDHPFRAKVIDFGAALENTNTWAGKCVQPTQHRAPEVILGLPFTEAIDVWALGTIMSSLILGYTLFPGQREYEVLKWIIDLLGDIPKNLVRNGLWTENYYKKVPKVLSKERVFKTPHEMLKQTGQRMPDVRKYQASSMSELKAMHGYRRSNRVEADICFDLMEKMLQIDPKKRITAEEILEHPFITGNYDSPTRGCTNNSLLHPFMGWPLIKRDGDCPQPEKKNINPPKVEDTGDSTSTSDSDSTDSSDSSDESQTEDSDSIPKPPLFVPQPPPMPEPMGKRKKKGLCRFFSYVRRNILSFFCATDCG